MPLGQHVRTRHVIWSCALVLVVLTQGVATLSLHHSFALRSISNLVALLLMGSAVGIFLVDAAETRGRLRTFWILLATSWALTLLAQLMWIFFELVLRRETPNPFVGDILLFLSEIPALAALLLQPHVESRERRVPTSTADFFLLLLWWLYLYLFFVIPWQYVALDEATYGTNYNRLDGLLQIVLLAVVALWWTRSSSRWKLLYAFLFLAEFLVSASSYLSNRAIDLHVYYSGSWYDLLDCLGPTFYTVVGLLGSQVTAQVSDSRRRTRALFSVNALGMVAVLSLPFIAGWTLLDRDTPVQVMHYRELLTMATMFVMASLVFVNQHRLGEELTRTNRVLQEASMTDPLTGVRNRRFFHASIPGDVSQVLRSFAGPALRRNRDLIFYLLDLDNFKKVNDRFGHDIGDKVLVEVAIRIASAIRESDILVRWGGEEFLVVSRNTTRGEGEALASRILNSIGGRRIQVDSSEAEIRQTCSIGWAAFPWIPEHPENSPWEAVLIMADRALYQAKQTGKNRAVGLSPINFKARLLTELPLDEIKREELRATLVCGPAS